MVCGGLRCGYAHTLDAEVEEERVGDEHVDRVAMYLFPAIFLTDPQRWEERTFELLSSQFLLPHCQMVLNN